MEDSIFTKSIKGEIPCHKVYEDDLTFVFLDNNPLTPGHCLVVPKKQVDSLWELDNKLYQYVMEVVRNVAMRQQEVLNPKRVGMSLEGFAVPHAHVHVFPLNKGLESTTIDHINKVQPQPTPDEMVEIAKKLAF